jgi:hypothetical protein
MKKSAINAGRLVIFLEIVMRMAVPGMITHAIILVTSVERQVTLRAIVEVRITILPKLATPVGASIIFNVIVRSLKNATTVASPDTVAENAIKNKVPKFVTIVDRKVTSVKNVQKSARDGEKNKIDIYLSCILSILEKMKSVKSMRSHFVLKIFILY